MKKSSIITLALTLTSLFIFTACAGSKPKNLEIGLLSNIDAVPFIIAQENGYFDENVKFSVFTSAQERDSAFQSGAIDGVAADVLAACFAKNGGIDVKVTSLTDGIHRLVVGKDTGISDIQGLAGKKIAISSNTVIEYTLDSMLTKMGVDIAAVEKTPIAKIPQRLEMLIAGQVDSALFPEPFATSSILSGATVLLTDDELGISSSIMMFKATAINEKKNEIKKMYEAYNKAVDYLNTTDREQYIDLLLTKLAFPENLREQLELPVYIKATLPEEEVITSAVNWLLEKQMIDKAFTYTEMVSKDFAK